MTHIAFDCLNRTGRQVILAHHCQQHQQQLTNQLKYKQVSNSNIRIDKESRTFALGVNFLTSDTGLAGHLYCTVCICKKLTTNVLLGSFNLLLFLNHIFQSIMLSLSYQVIVISFSFTFIFYMYPEWAFFNLNVS